MQKGVHLFIKKENRLEPDKSRLAKACDNGVARGDEVRWRHSQVSRRRHVSSESRAGWLYAWPVISLIDRPLTDCY